MRELVFENIVSKNKRLKEVRFSEKLSENGKELISERRSYYLIKAVQSVQSCNNSVVKIKKSIEEKLGIPEKRNLSMFRNINTKNKKESALVFISGHLYIINCDKVYLVKYLHTLKIRVVNATV